MSFTNAQLAQQIADLISYWSTFNEEYSNWVGGEVGGGPNTDGDYPLTNWAGEETLLACPAQLADDVTGYVAIVDASAVAAAASAAAALASETQASADAATATAQAVLADADRVAAETAEANAASSETVATAQANLATDRAGYSQEWAQAAFETPVSVAAGGDGSTDFSALHWATVAEGFAGSVDSGLYGQLAQNETITGQWTVDNSLGMIFKKLGDADTGQVYYDGSSLRLLNNRAGGSIYLENNTYVLNSGSFIVQGGLATVQTADTLSKMYYRAQSDHNYIDSVGNATSLRMLIAGVEKARVDATGINVTGSVTAALGSSAAPSINFNTDTNTGLYRFQATKIGFACGGVQGYQMSQANFGTGSTYGPLMQRENASTTNPTLIAHSGDQTTGIGGDGLSSAGLISLISLGVERLQVKPTGVDVTGTLAATGAVTGSNLNVSNWDTAYGWGDHSGLYLPLAGGTLEADTFGLLEIKRTSTTNASAIAYSNTDGIKGYFGITDLNALTYWSPAIGVLWQVDGAGKMTVGDGTQEGGTVLAVLSASRAWNIDTVGTGSSCALRFNSTTNKRLFIGGVTNGDLAEFNTGSMYLNLLGDLYVTGDMYMPGTGSGKLVATATAGSMRISDGTYYADIGPRNSSFCHFDTNASAGFYFYKNIQMNADFLPSADSTRDLGSTARYWALGYIDDLKIQSTGDITKTSHGNYLYHKSTSYDNDQNGQVSFGTGAASGGTTGDIHFQYT